MHGRASARQPMLNKKAPHLRGLGFMRTRTAGRL